MLVSVKNNQLFSNFEAEIAVEAEQNGIAYKNNVNYNNNIATKIKFVKLGKKSVFGAKTCLGMPRRSSREKCSPIS